MYFETTVSLINEVKPYITNAKIEITSETKNCRNKTYDSDFVSIDAKNHVGFEVFDNEVIVFYFTDHYHFEDYSSKLQAGEEDYIERAKAFLRELFEYRIRHVANYKGSALYSEKYYIVFDDGREDACISNTWYGLSKLINPFGKKSTRCTTWQYDNTKGYFTTKQPRSVDSDAVTVIDISDDCYIEIFNSHNVYTYQIMEIEFDDYDGMYYWAPAANVLPTGMYDTVDKAIIAAREALQCRGNQINDT